MVMKETGEKIVFLSDIRFFIEFVDKKSVDEISHYLEQYYHLLEQTLDKLGGEIIQSMRDAIIAIIPTEQENDVISACIELQKEFYKLSRPQYKNLDLSIGLHRGKIVVHEHDEGSKKIKEIVGPGLNVTGVLCRLFKRPGIKISEFIYDKLNEETKKGFREYSYPFLPGLPDGMRYYILETADIVPMSENDDFTVE